MEAEPFDVLAALRDIEGDTQGALDALESGLELDPNAPERWLDACQLAIDLEAWDAVDRLRSGWREVSSLPAPTPGLAKLEMAMTGAPSANSRWPATSSWTGRSQTDVLSALARCLDRATTPSRTSGSSRPSRPAPRTSWPEQFLPSPCRPAGALGGTYKVVALLPGNEAPTPMRGRSTERETMRRADVDEPPRPWWRHGRPSSNMPATSSRPWASR